MYFYSPQSLEAEISYRQERMKRDFRRPPWFKRTPRKPVTPTPRVQPARARHAM